MLTDTGKRLSENEKTDAMYIIAGLNVSLEYLRNLQDFSQFTDQQVMDYWSGICDAFIEARVNEHRWRKDLSKKYDLPYTFVSRNGDLLIDDLHSEV